MLHIRRSGHPLRAAAGSHEVRRGQAIVEFAVIAFLLTILLGAMLTFGFLLFGANVLQQAADVGAMELARHPDAPTATFQSALTNSDLYSEAELVVPVGTDPADLSLINRLLFPLYIYDPDLDMVRYPGTVVTNGDDDMTVVIPIIGPGNRDATTAPGSIATTGADTISEWRRVVEEVVPTGESAGPYSMTATPAELGGLAQPGMVALRINYPFQSAALVAYVHTDQVGDVLAPPDTIGQDDVRSVPIGADDGAVNGAAAATFPDGQTLAAAGYTLVNPAANPSFGASAHRGTYGFGEVQAFLTTVRPYRKVLSAQGIYRREVFE
ncbi:MAG: pilus assembly protein [Planctomycetaceae bacterium]